MDEMTKKIADREQAAFAAAAELCAHIDKTDIGGLALHVVSPEAANGSNSLDAAFMAKLNNRDHLDDSFLADAV